MSSSVTALGEQNRPGGFCSRCHKVWVLKERQGVCRWCGKVATCQTTKTSALRGFKSNRSSKPKQADPLGNGYDHLSGNWLTFYTIASKFSYKAKPDERDDLLHDIILTLADVERNNGHHPFTEAAMYRIASRAQALYWRKRYRMDNGLTCGDCSKAQRRKCKEDWLFSACPKAVKLESLNKPVTDDEGNTTELGDLIADDRALDLDAWLDANTFLLQCPDRLIAIAEKRRDGLALDNAEMIYLCRFRKREQKSLFSGERFSPVFATNTVGASAMPAVCG
ncbi:hypothetical protein DEALK_18220 [Dehalogenimonas alkenigignens]|uniref:Uncharacterized protein n=1 Tax=Dehalogenimonas alkenigignens TaxID=1217799 RepID=A0A0W0GKA3_9CHLR|nr:hypothetical protein DEALK_18220 [Dehalogenimonas alkenigignens]